MSKKSRLHIPAPNARPGDEPDFSYLDLSPAGSVDKPAIDTRPRNLEHLASGLVRVLDDDHSAKGPWNPNFDATQLQVGLRWMDAFEPRIRRTHVANPAAGSNLLLHAGNRRRGGGDCPGDGTASG